MVKKIGSVSLITDTLEKAHELAMVQESQDGHEWLIEETLMRGKPLYKIRKLETVVLCQSCKNYLVVGDQCDRCGAKRDTDGSFKLMCHKCGKKVTKLYGLFVPHLCHDCYIAIREEQIQKHEVCTICGKPYVDCYC